MLKLQNIVRRIMWSQRLQDQPCTHIDQIRDVEPSSTGCEECM